MQRKQRAEICIVSKNYFPRLFSKFQNHQIICIYMTSINDMSGGIAKSLDKWSERWG